MEKKEKVEFILEQMRLCIAVKDYIRTQIISKKINTKFFTEDGTEVRQRGHTVGDSVTFLIYKSFSRRSYPERLTLSTGTFTRSK